MTTTTKATATKAATNKATNRQATKAAKPDPFAMFKKQAEKANAKLTESFDNAVSKEVEIATNALAKFERTATDGTSDVYNLLIATNTADSLQAASGAKLAELVQSMIESYYKGNKEALQPVIEACGLWLQLKTDGTVKTANIPNNLRLLVGRRSTWYAQENELDIKLTLSTDGGNLVIKESPVKAAPKKTQAQKVFEVLTKLDMLELDELSRLCATDGRLVDALSTIGAITNGKSVAVEVSRKDLEARRNAASETEGRLDTELAQAMDVKADLADKVADLEDRLQANEDQLTKVRSELATAPEDKKATTLLAKLIKADGAITKELNKAREDLRKANDKVGSLDKAYSVQAKLCATLGQRLTAVTTH